MPATERLSRKLAVTPEQLQQTLSYYSSFIVIAAIGASVGPLLPWLAEQTSVSLAVISSVFVIRPIGNLLGAWSSGRLYDALPGHRVSLVAIVSLGAFTAMIPFVTHFYLLLGILFFSGYFANMLNVGGNLLTMRVHGLRSAPFVNALHFVFSTGGLLSPLIIAQSLLWTGGIATALWMLSLMAIIPALFFLRVPSPARPDKQAASTVVPGHGQIVVLISLFYVFTVGADVGFAGWIYTYGLEMGIGDKVSAAYLTSLYWIAQASGRFLAIPVAARLRPRTILIVCLAAALAVIVSMTFFPANRYFMWPATFFLGLTMGPLFPAMLGYARNTIQLTGSITGRFFIGASSGAMTVPWIIGQFFEAFGPTIVLYMDMSVLVLASLIVAMILKIQPDK